MKSAHLTIIVLVTISLVTASPSYAAAEQPFKLNPQLVVDAVLKQGLDAKISDLRAEQAEYGLSQAQGTYDWTLSSSASYELTRLQSLMGLSNLEDRNTLWKAGVSKKLPSGTTLNLSYNRQFQNSITNSFLNTAHPPDQVLDYVDFGFKQELLMNAFGANDRKKVIISKQDFERAQLKHQDELQDLALKAIQLFWKAYVSGYSLKESILARDKYNTLIGVMQSKLSRGLAEPSDLGKVKTQFSAQDRRVKATSLQHLDDLDNLFLAMHTAPLRNVEFDVSTELPSPPVDTSPSIDKLRSVQAMSLLSENAKLERERAQLATFPELNLIGNLSTNGVNTTAAQSFTDMTSATHPRYLVGIEFKYRLDSSLTDGELRFRKSQEEQALTQLQQFKEAQVNNLQQAERNVRSSYLIAQTAQDAANQWEAIIKDRERQFRGARVGTSEIIQDYSLYFQARADAVSALADYYYSLYRFKAANDQLVRSL